VNNVLPPECYIKQGTVALINANWKTVQQNKPPAGLCWIPHLMLDYREYNTTYMSTLSACINAARSLHGAWNRMTEAQESTRVQPR
jgi:hypothetical protein